MNAMKKGPRIGQGKPAEVFAWGDNQVLKLYREGWPRAKVEQEARLIQVAYSTSLPVYNVMDVVEVEGRPGIIMEHIRGTSMQKTVEASPMKFVTLAPLLSELHAQVHAISVSGLPSQRQHMEGQIRAAQVLSEDIKQKALHALARLPEGNTLCHGDFHPDNIMMTAKGPIIIDWCMATQGNPLADVANTKVLIQYGVPEGKPLNRFMQWGRRWFQWFYVRHYLQLMAHSASRQEIAAWELPALAAKIGDFVPQEHQLWAFPQEQTLMLARMEQLLSHSVEPESFATSGNVRYRNERSHASSKTFPS